jgi:tetratricopeptide (TPR) repeat protein
LTKQHTQYNHLFKEVISNKAKYLPGPLPKYAPIYIFPFICYWLTSCAPTVVELAETDPEAVIARKSELLTGKSVSEEARTALINAYNNLGNIALKANDFNKAKKQFNESLLLDNKNKQAKYGLAMIEGRLLFKKGNKSALWDSMEQFGKASYYNPDNGEPHYWMGRAYEKKDDGDFELIIEAYEKALNLTLPEVLKQDAHKRLAAIKKQQKTYEEFWK